MEKLMKYNITLTKPIDCADLGGGTWRSCNLKNRPLWPVPIKRGWRGEDPDECLGLIFTSERRRRQAVQPPIAPGMTRGNSWESKL